MLFIIIILRKNLNQSILILTLTSICLFLISILSHRLKYLFLILMTSHILEYIQDLLYKFIQYCHYEIFLILYIYNLIYVNKSLPITWLIGQINLFLFQPQLILVYF